MGDLTYGQLRERVAGGRLDRHYFLKTKDPLLCDEAIRLLADAHLPETARGFDLDQVSGDAVEAEALASILETPPLLSPRRVAVVRDAQRLSPSARRVLEESLQRPVDGRVIIVAAEIPRGSRAKFYRRLADCCRVVSLDPPKSSQLPGWLVRRAREVHGLELEVEAARRMVAALGDRLGVLAQELEKLATYAADRDRVTLQDVERVVGVVPGTDRWSWVDAVMDRQFSRAIDELPGLLDGGESAIGLIIALGESLLRVGLAGEGREALVDALKRDGSYGYLKWKIRIYERQAAGWSVDAIDRALEELLRADRLIKSGGLADRVALEEAVLRIAGQEMAGETTWEGKGRQGASRAVSTDRR